MRISRTNFYPILETEGENDESASYYSYENNDLPEEAVEAPVWHAEGEAVAASLGQGARVRYLPVTEPTLERHGKIAALLRF